MSAKPTSEASMKHVQVVPDGYVHRGPDGIRFGIQLNENPCRTDVPDQHVPNRAATPVALIGAAAYRNDIRLTAELQAVAVEVIRVDFFNSKAVDG